MCVGCQANPRHRPPRAVAELTSLGPHDRHPHHEQAQRPYKVGPRASLKAKGTPSPLEEREGRESSPQLCEASGLVFFKVGPQERGRVGGCVPQRE